MKNFWDERYQLEEYVYGQAPNAFFQSVFDKETETGKVLFTAEGEGRNAVYAALKGWEVFAFDYSTSAKEKAEKLAKDNGVSFVYETQSVTDILSNYAPASMDRIVVIYNHFPPEMRVPFHQALPVLLKPGGKIIMEVFNKSQLGNPSGGPKDIEMLYSKALLAEEFATLELNLLEEVETTLNEGRFHSGKANVVRMIATKR